MSGQISVEGTMRENMVYQTILNLTAEENTFEKDGKIFINPSLTVLELILHP